jgi:hypothetical protein
LIAGVERCRALADDEARLLASDDGVSAWTVGLHVQHLWRSDSGILGWIQTRLDDPAPAVGAGGPTRTGRAVLVSGWIPRGRAKAPERSEPGTLDIDGLPDRLAELRALADALEPRLRDIHACSATMEHPILGHFTPAQWLRFLDIHHRHHDKIIRDIG